MSEHSNKKSNWNSLEVVKLAGPVVAALIVVFIGLGISKDVEQFKTTLARSDKQTDTLVAKRLALYDLMGRKLNQMFTYYMYVGKWKQLSPVDIVGDKRELDELVYGYQPFFSENFLKLYKALEAEMFRTNNQWGIDAQSRSEINHRPKFYHPVEYPDIALATSTAGTWDPKWDAEFTGEDNTAAIRDAYSRLISVLPSELGIPAISEQAAREITTDQLPNAELPTN